MLDPSARRSRRLTGSLQAHRGRAGVVTAGLPRPGRVFGRFQYLSPPVLLADKVADAEIRAARRRRDRAAR